MKFIKGYEKFTEGLAMAGTETAPSPSPKTTPAPGTNPKKTPGKRPTPIRRDKPGVTKKPMAKKKEATVEDVINKYAELTNQNY